MASENKPIEFENAIYDIPIASPDDRENVNNFSRNLQETVPRPTSAVNANELTINESNPTPNGSTTTFPRVTLQNNNIANKIYQFKFQTHQKDILKAIAIFVSISIIIYLSTKIYIKRSHSIRKCQMCGEPVKFPTFLGDLVGNECKKGSMGSPNYNCGLNAACFKMDVAHSDEWRLKADQMKEYLSQIQNWSDMPISVDPYLNDGTFRGCMNGFFHWSGDTNCHFFNSTNIGHNIEDGTPNSVHTNQTWFTTRICACTSDNCN